MILFFIPQFILYVPICYTSLLFSLQLQTYSFYFLQGPLITSQSYIMIHIMQHNVHSATQVSRYTARHCCYVYYIIFIIIYRILSTAPLYIIYTLYILCACIQRVLVFICVQVGTYFIYIYTFGQLLNLISHSLIDVIRFVNHSRRRRAHK